MRSINKVKLEKIAQMMIYGWFKKLETHNQLTFSYDFNSRSFSLYDNAMNLIIEAEYSASKFVERASDWLERESIEL